TPSLPNGWTFEKPVSGVHTWKYGINKSLDFIVKPDTQQIKDLKISTITKTGWFAVRGIKNTFTLTLENNGNTSLGNISCKIKSDHKLKSIQLISGNYTSTDSSLDFTASGLALLSDKNMQVEYAVPNTDSGTVTFKCNCYTNVAEKDSINNENISKFQIVNAHDPNDKQASEPERMKEKPGILKYLVRFQNTGNWPATTVIVRDTLSPNLDTNSFELVNTSHNCIAERNGYAIAFVFNNINLQDSATNEPESHGYINYSVKLNKNYLPYQKIKNTAHIYFDAEKPIVTNTTTNYWVSPPTLVVNGKDVMTINSCDTFVEPGCVASDIIDGNLTPSVVYVNKITNHIAGKYVLRYFVVNSHGDSTWAKRTVTVVDDIKPHIYSPNGFLKDGDSIKVQLNYSFIDPIYASDSCSGPIPKQTIPGFNGPVNSSIIGNYPIQYFAKDTNGNVAWENGYTLIYQVNDYIAPVITQNSPDTICHQINTPFTPDTVNVTDNYYPKNQISLIIKHSVNSNVAGDYMLWYEATDGSGNIGRLGRVIRVSDCNNIGTKENFGADISVHPIPASHQITITGIPNNYRFGKIQILDLTGKCIYSYTLNDSPQEIRIDTEDLPNGYYLVRTIIDTKIFIKKIEIQH
ncbi:MAG: DUF5011 domain-containing protein, partial [Bacteroidia bacterium]|nr:DUF5011 domain-containing protein [Bacteroidia bacterium]